MRKRAEPTKSNLIRLKREAALARSGLEILDRKREILLREFTLAAAEYGRKRETLSPLLKSLYAKTREAIDSAGPRMAAYETLPVPGFVELREGTRRVMGVRIPVLTIERCEKNPHPLSPGIDSLADEIAAVFPAIIGYAETLCALTRMARELSKTRKREKAIEEIHIPAYERDIAIITESLDENEREELSRYKSLKRRLSLRMSESQE